MGTPVLAWCASCETPGHPLAEFATNDGNIVNTLSHPLTLLGQDYYLEIPHNATKVKNVYSPYAGDVGDSLDGVVSVMSSDFLRFQELDMDAAGATINLFSLVTAADVLCTIQLVKDGANHKLLLLDSAGTLRYTSALNPFTEGVWHGFEVCVVRSTTAGVCWVYVDGLQVAVSFAQDFGSTAGDVRAWFRGQSGAISGTATVPLWANPALFGDGGGSALTYADFQSASGYETLCIPDRPSTGSATPDFEVDGTTDTPVDLDSLTWSHLADDNAATYGVYYEGHGGACRGNEPWYTFCGQLPPRRYSFRDSSIIGATWAWNFYYAIAVHGAGVVADAADNHVLWGRSELTGAAQLTDTSAGIRNGYYRRMVPYGNAMCPNVDYRYLVQGFYNATAGEPLGNKPSRVREHWCCYVVNTPLTPRRDNGPPNYTARDPDSDRTVK